MPRQLKKTVLIASMLVFTSHASAHAAELMDVRPDTVSSIVASGSHTKQVYNTDLSKKVDRLLGIARSGHLSSNTETAEQGYGMLMSPALGQMVDLENLPSVTQKSEVNADIVPASFRL